MNTADKATAKYLLPVRTQWLREDVGSKIVVAGTKGAVGDAGWTVIECSDRDHAVVVMDSYPSARMPCWARIESGEL